VAAQGWYPDTGDLDGNLVTNETQSPDHRLRLEEPGTERETLGRAGASLIVAKTGLEDELTGLAPDADGILTNWKPVTAKTIRKAPKCVSIGRYGIGLDNIDVACATELGIIVTNVPEYCVDEVSEHAMALLLSLARKVTFFDRAIKGGSYNLQAQTLFTGSRERPWALSVSVRSGGGVSESHWIRSPDPRLRSRAGKDTLKGSK